MRFILLVIGFLFTQSISAQVDAFSKWKVTGYLETYFSYDFNLPDNHRRPSFLYNFNRHNEFSVNLALVKATYTDQKVRSTLAVMTGTYAQANLTNEPTWAQFVNEASIGFQLAENFWLDVGIMPSHIGFESWIGTVGWHLTRSLMAENSPYFLTGARLSYEWKDHTEFTFWMSNGWQNIQRNQNNQGIGVGVGVKHSPKEGLTLNYANYLGNESVVVVREMRFFNNFYIQHELPTWGYTLGADMGIQEFAIAPSAHWWGVTASLKKSLVEKYTAALRVEYYSDPRAVILIDPFKISGFSMNLDVPLADNLLWRVEGRRFWTESNAFLFRDGSFTSSNTAITSSLAWSF
jgi:hypothetical protein